VETNRGWGICSLLATRRFLPLCVAQACGALNDNLVRNALVVLALFKAGAAGPVLVALAAGLFVFPYMLFSATAGQLADSRDKSQLIRLLKWAELALMSVAALGFLIDSVPILLLVLVGLGVQASFFGPLKYGILPDHLKLDELLAGNALVEATTFLAILTGTMAGGWLVLHQDGARTIASAGLGVAMLGLLAAWPIPAAPPCATRAPADWHILRATIPVIREAREDPAIWTPILGISWFWTLGATLVAQFPVVAKVTLGAEGEVVSLFLTMFSLGIGAGSLLCALLLRNAASPRLAVAALLGISLFTWDFATNCAEAQGLTTVAAVLGSAWGWRILLDLILLSACGGLYSVPLYAEIQRRARPDWRARMVSANNVLNAAFMVAGAVIAAVLAAAGVPAPRILTLMALVNLIAAFGAWRWLRPDPVS
jgi:acyl-[acyl-carrier-protein]-phospholipid O-acyltransferase / long-chain-fatty-acid--[acyl-carrier-protein] ligase